MQMDSGGLAPSTAAQWVSACAAVIAGLVAIVSAILAVRAAGRAGRAAKKTQDLEIDANGHREAAANAALDAAISLDKMAEHAGTQAGYQATIANELRRTREAEEELRLLATFERTAKLRAVCSPSGSHNRLMVSATHGLGGAQGAVAEEVTLTLSVPGRQVPVVLRPHRPIINPAMAGQTHVPLPWQAADMPSVDHVRELTGVLRWRSLQIWLEADVENPRKFPNANGRNLFRFETGAPRHARDAPDQ